MPLEPLTAERRRQQTRQYLLQAAAEVFAARGFHEATLDEVAAAAGFTKGAVYSNFKNKEDLFLALLEEAYDQDMRLIQQTLEASDVPPEARLTDFVAMIRRGATDAPDSWGILYLEFAMYAMRNPQVREKLNQIERKDILAIRDIIAETRTEQEIKSGQSAEDAARIIVALFHGLGMMRALDPDAIDDALLADAIAFVARGLGVSI
ncbi:MAG TPA: TetR/AcrR family transcriptional regulator [Acidimicrobiales bacterium]|nr:TetR/AcrR family transcriptional regulator [Acidimicrobiales bacterium]